MEELFQRLDQLIRGLIDRHQQILEKNQDLQQGKVSLLNEKKILVEKNQSAIAQINILLTKLKAIEKQL